MSEGNKVLQKELPDNILETEKEVVNPWDLTGRAANVKALDQIINKPFTPDGASS